MKIHIHDGLAYASGSLAYQGKELKLQYVVVDTGSTGSVFSSDLLESVGLVAELRDRIRQVRGVGGIEYVFTRQIDRLTIDGLEVENFEIEVGAMDYGFEVEGIVGLDFLLQTGAIIDLAQLEIRKGAQI
jgi:hypothetical protein